MEKKMSNSPVSSTNFLNLCFKKNYQSKEDFKAFLITQLKKKIKKKEKTKYAALTQL